MPFRERLKALREAAGLTQEALARAADVSVSYVSKLERTDLDPAWSMVQRLAAALKVDCTAFADCEGVSAPPKKRGKKGE